MIRSSCAIVILCIAAIGCAPEPRPDVWSSGPIPVVSNPESGTPSANVEVRPLDPKRTKYRRSSLEEQIPRQPEKTLDFLREGNERFMKGQTDHPRQDEERRESQVDGQKPHTIVLSCSDSRVPPEIVFDQGIGDLFVVRTAGEVADGASVASIEYAIEHLGAKLLVVMGHHSCGAVKAALSTPKEKSAGSKDLDKLVSAIRPHLGKITADNSGPHLDRAVRAQARGVVLDLLKRSKIIRDALDHREIEIAHGIYMLETGRADLIPFVR